MDMINDFMIDEDLPVKDYSAAFDDGRFGFIIGSKKLKDKLLLITTRAANAYNESAGQNKFRFSIDGMNNQCCLNVYFEDYDGILLEVSNDWYTIDRYYVRNTNDGWFLNVDHDVSPSVTVTSTGRVKRDPIEFPKNNYTRLSRTAVCELFNLPVKNASLFLAGNEILSLPVLDDDDETDYNMSEGMEVVLNFIETSEFLS